MLVFRRGLLSIYSVYFLCGFKQQLYADDSQFCLFRAGLSPKLLSYASSCALDMSTWDIIGILHSSCPLMTLPPSHLLFPPPAGVSYLMFCDSGSYPCQKAEGCPWFFFSLPLLFDHSLNHADFISLLLKSVSSVPTSTDLVQALNVSLNSHLPIGLQGY